jgi:glyoxylase-like metal-dependent hydrolase (beta-lactamase superfamily II)
LEKALRNHPLLPRILLGVGLLLVGGALLTCNRSSPQVEVRTLEDFPFDPGRSHQRDFSPSGALRQISPSLYVFEDSCNVYVLKSGDKALLIDFGTGDILNAVADIGVTRVDRVLITHHHRDQVQGLVDLGDYSFQVVAPAGESKFLEDVEAFWRDVRIYVNYNLRSHWNTLRKSIRVDQKVQGGDRVSWEGIDLRVLDTPGATDHSISYSAEIDGRQMVFSGDLIAGKGKVHNWYDLHWDYYGFTQGIDASESSFRSVQAENPDLLLPSHGSPIEDPSGAMAENSRLYATLREMLVPNELHRTIGEMRQILPHLVHLGGSQGKGLGGLTSYAILSDSGKALLYDYGYAELEQVEELKDRFGIDNIDVVTFSHYHDDHLIRAYDLYRENRTEIWVLDKMADVLENPDRYRLPCLVPFPIKPDRVVRDGERVDWEEYTLEFFHQPGQTEFHQGLVTVIDGKKVMFTGDNTWKKIHPDKTRNGPVVPQNVYFLDGGFITCAQKMLEYRPDIVCPAHTEEYRPTVEDLEEFLDWAYRLRDVMTGLILQPDPNFGMDYRWCHFYPYRSVAANGEPFQVELVIRNHLFKTARVDVELKTSANLICPSPRRSFSLGAKKQVAVPFTLRRVGGFGHREVVTGDITINSQRLGEVAEGLID